MTALVCDDPDCEPATLTTPCSDCGEEFPEDTHRCLSTIRRQIAEAIDLLAEPGAS